MKPGDVVTYWSRQPGTKPHLVIATVLALSPEGHWARVRRHGAYAVPVQTVDARRLKPLAPPTN